VTTLYLDTEFNDYRGQLISLALVAKSGKSFYSVLHCSDPTPWVAEHVMPVVGPTFVGLNRFQAELQQFLAQFDAVHIVADWPEDIQHFCWALITGPGERIDTPALTFEVRRDLNTGKSRIPHNALADASALMLMAEP